MNKLRQSGAEPQPPTPPEEALPDVPTLYENAIASIRRSARLRGARLGGGPGGLPLDERGKYLLVWPSEPGRRSLTVLHARGPVEAAALFAGMLGWTRPRFYGRTDRVLYVSTGAAGEPGAFCFYVLPASTPEAKAVSAYLRQAEDLHPVTHGGFMARDSSPFVTSKVCVVERRPLGRKRGGSIMHGYAQRKIGAAPLQSAVAERVATILNADLRLGAEVGA